MQYSVPGTCCIGDNVLDERLAVKMQYTCMIISKDRSLNFETKKY